MRMLRRGIALSLGAGLLLALGCSDHASTVPSAPAVPDDINPGLLGDGGTTDDLVDGLLACPHDESYEASKTIGPEGGTIKVGPHSLSIPKHALSRETKIKAHAPAGDYVLVDFEPEGLKFSRSPLLTLSTKDCGLLALTEQLYIVYTDDDLNILEVLPSTTDLLKQTVSAKIEHFSIYALAD